MLKLVTITGPSCSGKTTLVRELLKSGYFCEIVSFTSREPREGEVEGVDYYFKTIEECSRLVNNKLALEHTSFKGNYYGIEKKELENRLTSGKIPLVILEPNGLNQLYNLMRRESIYSLYVDTPVYDLYERFLERFSLDFIKNPSLDLKYQALRLGAIAEEYKSWRYACGYNKMIHNFTSVNKESIVDSLIKTLLLEKKLRDQSGSGEEG